MHSFELKCMSIDPEFYMTPAMTNASWKNPLCKERHVFTRHATHGFHYLLCGRVDFHEASPVCVCKYCNMTCEQYHFFRCVSRPFSLMSAANM